MGDHEYEEETDDARSWSDEKLTRVMADGLIRSWKLQRMNKAIKIHNRYPTGPNTRLLPDTR